MSDQEAPIVNSWKLCAIVCEWLPQWHSLLSARLHLHTFFPVLPTFVRTRLRVTQPSVQDQLRKQGVLLGLGLPHNLGHFGPNLSRHWRCAWQQLSTSKRREGLLFVPGNTSRTLLAWPHAPSSGWKSRKNSLTTERVDPQAVAPHRYKIQ